MTRCSVAFALLLAGAFARAEPAPAPVEPALNTRSAELAPFKLVMSEYLAGAVTTAVTVPGGLLLGAWLGTLSNNLVWAAVPAVLSFTVLTGVGVTLVEWAVGNWRSPDSARVRPALWVALGAQLVAVVLALATGVDVYNVSSTVVFTIVEALALPAAVTATMYLSRPQTPAPALAELQRAMPRNAVTVPLLAFGF